MSYNSDIEVDVHRYGQPSWKLTSDSKIETVKNGRKITLLPTNLSVPLLQSVLFNHAVERPFGRANLRINWPLAALKAIGGGDSFFGTSQPQPGDWLVIRASKPFSTFDGSAPSQFTEFPAYDDGSGDQPSGGGAVNCFLGTVVSVAGTQTAQPNGAVTHTSLTVELESWFDFMGRCSIGLLTDYGASHGTLMSRDSWLATWEAYVQNNIEGLKAETDYLGQYLAGLVRMSMRVKLPKTLFGDRYLGDVVRVVYTAEKDHSATVPMEGADKRTGQLYRSMSSKLRDYGRRARALEPIVGWAWLGMQSFNPQGATILDLILGSFGADRYMIELFPSMEATGDKTILNSAKLEVPIFEEDTEYTPPDLWKGTGTYEPGEIPSTDNFCPVLIYRMRPWRAETLRDFYNRPSTHETTGNLRPDEWNKVYMESLAALNAKAAAEGTTFSSGEAEEQALKQANAAVISPVDLDSRIADHPPTFGRYGDPKDVEHAFTAEEIISISVAKHIDHHITGATVDILNDGYGLMAFSNRFMGLPLYNPNIIDARGFKIFRTSWPFWDFPEEYDDRKVQELIEDGLISYWKTIALTAWQFVGGMYQYQSGTVRTRYCPNVNAGCAVFFDWSIGGDSPEPGSSYMYAYIESVTHSTVLGPDGSVDRYTDIVFSRGLINEFEENVNGSLQPRVNNHGRPGNPPPQSFYTFSESDNN